MSERQTPETEDAQFGTGRVTVDFARRLERQRDEAMSQRDRLIKAAKALVDRWETPSWKDVPHTEKFIRALDDAVAFAKGGKDA